MRSTLNTGRSVLALTAILTVGLLIVGCQHDPAVSLAGKPSAPSYTQVNLVSDLDTFVPTPITIDPNMLNAWGLAMDPDGDFGIAANHSGMGLFYDDAGNATLPAIQIPAFDGSFPGAPSGQVYNPTSEFVIPGAEEPAKFIFSTEDGVICAWASGPNASVVVSQIDENAVYKGLAMAMFAGKPYLYATNFRDHRIDVFDGNWNRVMNFKFADPTIPDNYSPFSITNIDGKLWVAYAIPKAPEFMDDTAGLGHGIINIFNPNGLRVRRFYEHGVLNSPWGITMAPDGFGMFRKATLIGNFGDGMINAFDPAGRYLGYLTMPGGDPIVIDGLWAVSAMPGRNQNRVFFTAGPNGENDGLFGYLQAE